MTEFGFPDGVQDLIYADVVAGLPSLAGKCVAITGWCNVAHAQRRLEERTQRTSPLSLSLRAVLSANL